MTFGGEIKLDPKNIFDELLEATKIETATPGIAIAEVLEVLDSKLEL